jgi:hypothetical protein
MPKFLTVGRIVAISILVLTLMGGCSLYGYANSVRTEGNEREQGLSAQYKVNQNDLSTYISTVYEQLDIANIKSAKMDTILTHAVQGRYGADGFKPNGQFFSAITEAYPDIKGTDVYDRILTAVQAGRAQFANKQDKLTDMKRAYNTWRYDGMLRSYFTQKYFPSKRLSVTVNGKTYTDSAALRMIDQMVLTQEAATAFETGKMAPLDLRKR